MKNLFMCTCGSTHAMCAYTILRITVGIIFLYHGYSKVFGEMGVGGTTEFFASVGIPAAGLMAFLVAYGELLGGLALILGLLTHWVAKVNVLIMLGAIWFVHLENGFNFMNGGYEFQLLLLVVNIYFITKGSGPYSVDHKFFHGRAEASPNQSL